jgi:hypothetical protein
MKHNESELTESQLKDGTSNWEESILYLKQTGFWLRHYWIMIIGVQIAFVSRIAS